MDTDAKNPSKIGVKPEEKINLLAFTINIPEQYKSKV